MIYHSSNGHKVQHTICISQMQERIITLPHFRSHPLPHPAGKLGPPQAQTSSAPPESSARVQPAITGLLCSCIPPASTDRLSSCILLANGPPMLLHPASKHGPPPLWQAPIASTAAPHRQAPSSFYYNTAATLKWKISAQPSLLQRNAIHSWMCTRPTN